MNNRTEDTAVGLMKCWKAEALKFATGEKHLMFIPEHQTPFIKDLIAKLDAL